MQQVGSDLAIAINTVYESPWFQVFIVFCVLFHALNGLRIAVLDLWPQLLEYQREALWLEWLILAPVYGLTVFIIIQRALTGS
jgi:succinate dehydrogenase / fumarate reductase cytochrome b subunit